MNILLALIENTALVVVLVSARHWATETRYRRWLEHPVVSGLLYGVTALVAMAAPVVLDEGYFFDGRSIVLSIAGLTGGWITAGVAATIAAVYRIWVGGIGVLPGVSTIVGAAALGAGLRALRASGRDVMRPSTLLVFGVVVHALTLWFQVFWLGETGLRAVAVSGPPMITLMPLATVLIGRIIVNQERLADLRVESERHAADLKRAVDALIRVVSQMVETRDPCTAGHQRRVAQLAKAIGLQLQLGESEIEAIETAAMIHDVGKIAIPAEVLAKPGALSSLERRVVRQHVERGYEIVRQSMLGDSVAELVLQHHERMDGSGYPTGLAGSDILKGARILMVADVVEAMCSHRPYRAACDTAAALDEIRQGAGSVYDREVAEACLAAFEHGFAFDAAGAVGAEVAAVTGPAS